MEKLFEDYIIKLFNRDNELVGVYTAHEFPTDESIENAIKLYRSEVPKLNAVYATIDKRFIVAELPFSE